MNLLKYVENQIEIENCLGDINKEVTSTFKECFNVCFESNFKYEELHKFKIDSVIDFLQEELNSGHWSEIPITIRQAFTAASFLKAEIIMKSSSAGTKCMLEEALKTVDMGLLLGAPLTENTDLLTESAKFISKRLTEVSPRAIPVEPDMHRNKRKTYNIDYYDMYRQIQGKEVVILRCPSIEVFNKSHFVPEKPVKLQDCITHWPATNKWPDVNYLLKVAGNRTIPVEIGSHYVDENWTQKLMSLKEFIRSHYLDEDSNNAIGYLAQHNLFDQITELKEDICIPEYCGLSRDYEKSCDPDINAWFGPKGTVSPLHFDPKDNLLAQVYGTKQILLYSPSDSEHLYPHSDRLLFNTGQVDPLSPDYEKYPKLRHATTYKCILEAGEMLYIPLKWWHHVVALDKSFSVSFWWR